MKYEQKINVVKTVTIGTASVLVAVKSPKKVIYIRNTSTAAQVITIAFDNVSDAVANIGIVLAPGEYITDANSEGYKAWNGDIKAISSAAGGTISVMITPEDEQ